LQRWGLNKFHPIGAKCRLCGAKNLTIALLELKYRRFALRALLPVMKSDSSFNAVRKSEPKSGAKKRRRVLVSATLFVFSDTVRM